MTNANAYPKLFGSPAARPEPHHDAAMVPGVRVKLSGRFLKNTGQQKGGEGAKTWTVLDVQAGSASWVVVNEPADTSCYTAAELAEQPDLKWRRIARANLVIVGRISLRNST